MSRLPASYQWVSVIVVGFELIAFLKREKTIKLNQSATTLGLLIFSIAIKVRKIMNNKLLKIKCIAVFVAGISAASIPATASAEWSIREINVVPNIAMLY